MLKTIRVTMTYERGYCQLECTKCSEVCLAGAIRLITHPDKSSFQIGYAILIRKNCVPLTDGKEYDNYARHCPTKAIEINARRRHPYQSAHRLRFIQYAGNRTDKSYPQ